MQNKIQYKHLEFKAEYIDLGLWNFYIYGRYVMQLFCPTSDVEELNDIFRKFKNELFRLYGIKKVAVNVRQQQ